MALSSLPLSLITVQKESQIQAPARHFSLFLLPWEQPFSFQTREVLWCWQAPSGYRHHYPFPAPEERLKTPAALGTYQNRTVKKQFCQGPIFSQLVCLPLPSSPALPVGFGVTTSDAGTGGWRTRWKLVHYLQPMQSAASWQGKLR